MMLSAGQSRNFIDAKCSFSSSTAADSWPEKSSEQFSNMLNKAEPLSSARSCSVCVVRLDPAVLENRKFREKNPEHDPRKPCIYVDMTYRTPEERFAQHRAGYKACRFVRNYGLQLIPRQYARFNPMTRNRAEEFESVLANRLRSRGYAVWQN